MNPSKRSNKKRTLPPRSEGNGITGSQIADTKRSLKTILASLCILAAYTLHAAQDGMVSGKAFSAQDPAIEIGDYISLIENGEVVYHRLHPKLAADFEFSEQFLVNGQSILEIRYLKNSVGFIFSSYKDYRVATSMAGSQIEKITISSAADAIDHIWKRDAEGFYSDYSQRSRRSSLPRF